MRHIFTYYGVVKANPLRVVVDLPVDARLLTVKWNKTTFGTSITVDSFETTKESTFGENFVGFSVLGDPRETQTQTFFLVEPANPVPKNIDALTFYGEHNGFFLFG